MQNLRAACFRRALVVLAFAASFTYAFVGSAQAQVGPSAADQERARIKADRDLAAREWQLRNIGKVKRVDVDVVPPQVPLGKVKEDYEGIQQANNDILIMFSAGKEIDYKMLGDAANDIRKRAGRLRSYLITLELVPDKERKRSLSEIEVAEMKPALRTLDASIVSLIRSPVFKEFGKVVDLESSTKALNDLDNIIDLSERIKRSIDRSLKSTRASR
jgi:hypothetical protein